jgi:hypothetical protein
VTALAQRAAAPAKLANKDGQAMGVGCGTGCASYLVLMALFGGSSAASDDNIGLFLLIGFVLMVVAFFIVKNNGDEEAEDYNSRVWPKLQAKWQRSVMCMRCGEITDPEA